MISRRFTLPQSVLACHCSTWAPLINVMLPAWLPLWMLIAIAYVYGVLCIAIEMCTTAEAVPWIVTVVSWSLAFHLCKALQPRVKEAKRSGKKAEFQVGCGLVVCVCGGGLGGWMQVYPALRYKSALFAPSSYLPRTAVHPFAIGVLAIFNFFGELC